MIKIWMKNENNDKVVVMGIWIIINLKENRVDNRENSEVSEVHLRKANEKRETKDENLNHEKVRHDDNEENLRRISSMR